MTDQELKQIQDRLTYLYGQIQGTSLNDVVRQIVDLEILLEDENSM